MKCLKPIDAPAKLKPGIGGKLLSGLSALGLAASLAAPASIAGAKIEIGDESWITIGAGIRFAGTSVEDSAPNGSDDSTDFDIQNIRLYVNGQVNDWIGLTLNTEEIDSDIDVLDAIVRLEFSDEFNIHMGRMLTPADRIEMNGPFYALSWNQYTQPLYPSDQGGSAGRIGRDEGITIWGRFDRFQYALGVFDGLDGSSTANQKDKPLFATRLAYNFLNIEDNPAYYTSSTYYGALGNIFTVGFSYQSQEDGTGTALQAGDFSGYTVDVLSETVLDSGGVVTVEAEYKEFDADFTVNTVPSMGTGCFCLFDGDSYFATAAYLFPVAHGPGRFQPYIRYVENDPSDGNSSDLTEVGLNYVIKGHNARLNLNFGTGDANITGYQGPDVDSVSVGVQLQI